MAEEFITTKSTILPQDMTSGDIAGKLIPINLSFMFSKTEMGLISMDVMLNEKVSFKGGVTNYPVEDGSEISDHIKQGTKELVISGTQSMAEGYSFNFASGKSRLIDVLLAMDKMHKERKLITVTTGLAIYKEMGIENMTATRSNGTPRDGNWIDISMELKYVRKVELKTADVPPEKVAPEARNRAGRSGTRASSPAAARPSGAGVTTGPTVPRTGAMDLYSQRGNITEMASGGIARLRGMVGF
jgi:hypothetical protein